MKLFKRKRPLWRVIIFRGFLLVTLIAVCAWAGFSYYLYNEIKDRFSSRRWSVPARVFSATVPIFSKQALSLSQLRHMLEARRYKESAKDPSVAGEYRVSGHTLTVYLRDFQFPGHFFASQRIQFDFQQNKIARIRGPKGEITFLELEPLEIARLFGPNRESRMLINITQVPRHLIDAIVCIEDHRFYDHSGVDLMGVLRAMLADFRAGKVVQGGSTITQQLVKNYFLVPERSFRRKALELSMSLILEALYEKDDILEMYMNEIYMGNRAGVAIHGIGEAARYYFGRNVEDLTLSEAATLAGIVRGPNNYSPITHPEAALERRNLVLKRMLDLRKISPAEYDVSRLEPIKLADMSIASGIAPYFIDYVRKQAQELYAPEALASEGLNIYTTLHPEMAAAAEAAVREGLLDLEKEIPADIGQTQGEGKLQAVLIAIQPKTGAIYALVGGRDYSESSFNRALSAHRQPGSALKPFVYLSALDHFRLSDKLIDLPTSYETGGSVWTPNNYDNRYHGRISVRQALEQSLNAATVHLAMEVGLDKVIETLRTLGIQSPLEPVPSLALGSFEVTPMKLAALYAVLDNDGQKPYLLSLKEIVDENGDVQERRSVEFSSVTTPAKAFLITSLLEGVIERGTGKPLKRQGIDFKCAGQTGTSSDYRDSWFAGFTTDLLVLVWVGYDDDNRPTSLTGAQGAGRIWARFLKMVRPWVNPQNFRIPPGVAQRIVCSESGLLATTRCTNQKLEYFLTENLLNEYCTSHSAE